MFLRLIIGLLRGDWVFMPWEPKPRSAASAHVGDVSLGALGSRKPPQAAAEHNRPCAIAKTGLSGQAEAMATLMRRTLTVTSAPRLRIFKRIVPTVAS